MSQARQSHRRPRKVATLRTTTQRKRCQVSFQGEASVNQQTELTCAAEGPLPDPDTSAALQVAGVSDAVLRLSGDTFHRFKNDYRKMSQSERLGTLAQMQLRIAAIYAVQNEDMQRQRRQDAQDRRHQDIEESRRRLEAQGLKYTSRQLGGPPRISHPGSSSHASTPPQIPSAQ